jgi:hypothetical protein
MTVKLIYDVVYDTRDLFEENGNTYLVEVGLLYHDMVEEGKIIDYSFEQYPETLTRTNTITYVDMAARNEHRDRYQLIHQENIVVTGRTITNTYLEDENGVRTLLV